MRRRLEFALVWAAVKLLSLPPRSVARSMGASIGRMALVLTPRLARVGDLNLRLAFPEKSAAERQQILRTLYRNLGWLLAEFCQMPRYTPETTRSFIRYEGLEHYLAARDQGKGVLILTGHLGERSIRRALGGLGGHHCLTSDIFVLPDVQSRPVINATPAWGARSWKLPSSL